MKYSLQAVSVQSYTDCLSKIITSSAAKYKLFCEMKYFLNALTWDNSNYFTFQQMSLPSSRNIEPPITSFGSVKPTADIVNFQGKERMDGHFQKSVLFLERVVVPQSFKHC